MSICGPLRIVNWYPTWILPKALHYDNLILYYAGNPDLLKRYAKIFKLLEDIIKTIDKRNRQRYVGKPLNGPPEELLGRRVRKKKANHL